jgi:hypothetical protein
VKYRDGRVVHVGDRVLLGGGASGVVVCSIDTGEYTDLFPESEWSYLQNGVLIESPELGLLHYPGIEDGPELVDQGSE